ncbi:MAG: hypothetical protein AAFX76_07385 [Planctomycetota bacterium]
MKIALPTSVVYAAALLLVSGLVAVTPSAPAHAQEASPEQKAEFNRMVRERNELHRELEGLDVRAVEAVKRGDDPIQINAQQVSVQDKLDLVQLRLEIVSMRYGLRLPPVPGSEGDTSKTIDGKPEERLMAEKAFARGHDRAMAMIRKESEEFARSLDFSGFLATLGNDDG